MYSALNLREYNNYFNVLKHCLRIQVIMMDDPTNMGFDKRPTSGIMFWKLDNAAGIVQQIMLHYFKHCSTLCTRQEIGWRHNHIPH